MTEDRPQARGEDFQHRLLDGGPVLGEGDAPDGTWELRALCDAAEDGSRYLYFYVEFWGRNGLNAGGGGCGGLGLANSQRPVVVSMSGQGARTSFCYVGQVVREADRIEVTLSDGSTTEARLMEGDLPVHLWIVFTDGTVVPVRARAFANERELGVLPIPEAWPSPHSGACWGPIDE